MTALVARSFGRVVAPFAAILTVLAGFQVALIAVAASLAETGEFERLARIVPSALHAALGPALSSFGNMAALGYFDVIIVMIVVQWSIFVATEPAGDIEAGLVDLMLARPVPRTWLITRSLAVTFASTLMLTLAMGIGTLVGLALFAPRGEAGPEPRLVLLLIAHLTALAWSFGAAGLAVSGWVRRRAAAVAIVTIASMTFYLVDFLGLWWAPMETVARLTPFYYFHGGPIVSGTSDPVRDLGVLGTVTLAGIVAAYWRFERRDL